MSISRVFLTLIIVVPGLLNCSGTEQFSIDELQGAWWAQEESPTAAFAIQGNEAWFDYDSTYHPAKIENGALIVDHGPELGLVKRKIISLSNGRLVLRDEANPSEDEVYTLNEPD